MWRWADRRNVKIEGINDQAELAHHETAAFVDAVHTASGMLRWIFPWAERLAHLRHGLRGTRMDPSVQGLTMLAHWNSSRDFLEGSEFAHGALLEGLWRPAGAPLPSFLEGSSREVLRSLDVARPAPPAREDAAPEAGDAELPPPPTDVVCVSSRFERLHGPDSLERIRHMTVSGFTSFRDPALVAIFQRETFADTPLRLEVASVVEAERGGTVLRRHDRLKLQCAFNLREGIASPFRITGWEQVLAEERRGGWDDE